MKSPFTLVALGIATFVVVAAKAPPSLLPRFLYQNDFEQAEPGKLPNDFKLVHGSFTVKQVGTNQVLESGIAPDKDYAVLFGPTESNDVMVNARILATTNGQRLPTFGVGLGGMEGYQLRVVPAKQRIELLRGTQLLNSTPFVWNPGHWLNFQLQLRKTGGSTWKVEGMVWKSGYGRPEMWRVACDARNAPAQGRAFVFGRPLSGTPIQYDDLKVERI